MLHRTWIAAAVCLAAMACGGKDNSTPSTPSQGGTGGEVQVSGSERLGWAQPASSAAELASIQYAIYVDNNRSVLRNVSCEQTAGSSGFDCRAPLPNLSAGAHTIELASFVQSGGEIFESERSSPALRVIRRSLTLSSGQQIEPRVMLSEQIQLDLELVADNLNLPSDLVFTPDGTILVAERGGLVRSIVDGRLLDEPALDVSGEVWLPEGGLLAVAIDRDYRDNRFLYTLTAAKARGGSLGFTLGRYRSLANRLGDRAVLLDRVAASPRGAGGALRFGADGKIFVALDAAENSRAAGSLGSYNGKVLRLNSDATTPSDQAGFSPVFSLDHPSPRALDWQPSTGVLWIVDGFEQGSGRLTAVAPEDTAQQRATVRTKYALPTGTGATSAAFYRGTLVPVFRDNLFVAGEMGRHLLRIQFDPKNPDRVLTAERIMQDQIGSVRVVSVGPDGALYVANDTALFKLVPPVSTSQTQ